MDLNDIIKKKDWDILIRNVLPVTIAISFPFEESMHVVGNLLNDSGGEDGDLALFMRDYAVNLMIILREKFPQNWKKDWKNEAFLGICCSLVYREEKAFKYLKNALGLFEDPPQSLILTYIRVGAAPCYFLSTKEIAELAQRAAKSGITFEVAQQMADSATTREGKNYWERKAAEANSIHTPVIVPNILKNVLKPIEDYPYES